MDNSVINILDANGIKPTTPRILILNAMLGYNRAFSLGDLEKDLLDIDKSTIFRTINLFHEKKIIHNFDDGSGSMKYSVSQDNCDCGQDDSHIHFYCNYCQKAFCLENVVVPKLELPDGIEMEDANFVIKGYCGKCKRNAT